jgi:MFS family permease
VPRSWVFAAFSIFLLIAAFAAPAIGRMIDRNGGREGLVLSNLILAGGLIVLAAANGALAPLCRVGGPWLRDGAWTLRRSVCDPHRFMDETHGDQRELRFLPASRRP